MNYNTTIGLKIKELRTQKKLTLKDLSEQTSLSTGFLSQLERGLTNISIDWLAKIAKVLDVELLEFFDDSVQTDDSVITRGYERKCSPVSDQIIQYSLSKNTSSFEILPRMVEVMPCNDCENEDIELYTHNGEEFIHVLEGILTLVVEDEIYYLYPGDSAHIKSTRPHNWKNNTSKIVKFITVHSPNPFKI